MPDSALKRVSGGQPLRIRAATWNAVLDAAEDYQRRQLTETGGRSPIARPYLGLPVSNDTGLDLDRFSVVGLDGPVFGPDDNQEEFDNNPVFSGVTPQEGVHAGLYAILADALRAGDIGDAILVGVARVAVDVSDESHGWAEIADGDCSKLVSASSGSAQILWAEPGTGLKDALVRLGGPPSAAAAFIQLTGVGENGTSPCELKRVGDEAFSENGTLGPYTAVPEGWGPLGTGDTFLALQWPDGTWHFPLLGHRLTGTGA